MLKKGKLSIYLIFTFACVSGSPDASAQQSEGFLNKGDNLREMYRFEESLTVYRQGLEAAEQESDSTMIRTIKDRILMSENGRNMTDFVYSPTVIARHKFSIDDFFLYYPLSDRSWRALPNQLDSVGGHNYLKAMYAPDGIERMYWSAIDEDGTRNLHTSVLADTVWTVPTLINEHLTSVSDEIYPLLSADGRHLYFSSAGLYGIGGYDLFVSDWNDDSQEWSEPENLGFPYSSPADDFLFYNTPDGKYTFFASNRECSKDSVWVYVLEFDNMPVRKTVSDPAQLASIASLEPAPIPERTGKAKVTTDIPENMDTRRYMEKMSEVRQLRDSISVYASLMDSGDSNAGARINLLRDSLDVSLADLQKIEMDFLFKGVVIDPDKLMAEADREIVNEKSGYVFARRNMGAPLVINMQQPEVKFDYSFKILEEGQFAEDQTLPSGVVYQIQIFATKNKAKIKDLKGLSPVYESKGANGHLVYRVGVFRTYNDVLANLNAVKRAGFKSAYIVPFIDGKIVKMAASKAKESVPEQVTVFYEVRIIPSGGSLDSVISGGIKQQAGGKDIARVQSGDGTVTYVVGPFDDRKAADALVQFIKAMGLNDVSLNIVK